MYSIAEKITQVGQQASRDNCRLWLRRDEWPTPAADEAAQYEDTDEAHAAAEAAGITLAEDSWWVLVDLEEEDEVTRAAEGDLLGQCLDALAACAEQMAKVRRFLPTHGSFGEDGISDFEGAQSSAQAILAHRKGGGRE